MAKPAIEPPKIRTRLVILRRSDKFDRNEGVCEQC